jgi:TctA family transporter
VIKWGIPLLAVVCSIAAIFYFWLVGLYSSDSLNYIFLIIVEIIIYFILKKLTTKSEEKQLREFQQT